MKQNNCNIQVIAAMLFLGFSVFGFYGQTMAASVRNTMNFGENWRFHLGEVKSGEIPELNDGDWRQLDVPHDWSIEGEFSEKNPATPGVLHPLRRSQARLDR